MAKDYYSILGIKKDSSADEIKKAYRKLAHKYHPDKGGGKDAEEKFKEINEAYQVLSDPAKRSSYDRFGSAGFSGGGGGQGGFSGFDPSGFYRAQGGNGGFRMDFDLGEDLGDVFDMFFGGGFGGGGRTRGKKVDTRGRDIQTSLEVDFKQAILGDEIKFSLEKLTRCNECGGTGAKNEELVKCDECGGNGWLDKIQNTMLGQIRQRVVCNSCGGLGKKPKIMCEKCAGQGRFTQKVTQTIDVPAGVENGMVLRIRGEGEAGIKGGESGDLLIKIIVKKDRDFSREGHNILSRQKISFAQAVLGAEIEVQLINGKQTIIIPAGTQNNETFKINGQGVPYLGNETKRGDHIVEIIVDVPKKISKQEKELIEQLAVLRGDKIYEENVFEKVKRKMGF